MKITLKYSEKEIKNYFVSSFVWGCLLACMIVNQSCREDDGPIMEEPPVETIDTDTTAMVLHLMHQTDVIGTFKSDTAIELASGLSYTAISFLTSQEQPIHMFVIEADLDAGVGIRAMSPYDDLLFGMQRVSEMCRDNEKADVEILAGINGDFFNTTTGQPEGYFYVNGIQLKTQRTAASRSYFAVYKDGTPVIGGLDPVTGEEVPVDLADVEHLVSGRHWLVNGGELSPYSDYSIEPRTAIGYTEANKVYTIVVDGRQNEYSVGFGIEDLQQVMKVLGVVRAINLDGGGSSTLAVKVNERGEREPWKPVNSPSDGAERRVANGIAFTMSN